MEKLTIGLIGGGRIGQMHALNLVSLIPQARLKSIADPRLEKNWVEQAGIPVLVRKNQEIFNDPEIKAVVITAPTGLHVDLVKAAAEAGKHIFCEKPIAIEPARIQEALKAVEKAGVHLFVGYNRRFDASFIKVRQYVQEEKIGQIQMVKITNRDPKLPPPVFLRRSGGLFMDFTVHDFDMSRYLTGSEVEEISVMGAAFYNEMAEAGDMDTAVINMRMANGTLVNIDNSRQTLYGYDQRLEVFGSKGSVIANNETSTQVVLNTEEDVISDKPLYSFIERYREAYITEMRMFIEGVLQNQEPPVGGQDALKAVEIAIAAQQALEEKRTIRIDKYIHENQ